MQELAGIDAAFLYMETTTAHMHVMGTVILESDGEPFDFDRLKRKIASRLPRVPPFRRRLVQVPLRLGHPVWIDDPDFRIGAHLHRIALPRPGSMRELANLVSHLASIPLDRHRPLWDLWAVEGLRGGRTALICKFHHAAIDGVSGAELMQHLFDLEPDAPDDEPAETQWSPDGPPSDLLLLTNALKDFALQPARLLRIAGRTAVVMADVAAAYINPKSDVNNPALPMASPNTLVNTSISADRATAFGRVSLRDIKDIKNALGLTVNDVILAACSLALRRYLEKTGTIPQEPLVAAVPVSTHAAGQDDSNNAISAMFVRLPTHLEKPEDHLSFVQAEAIEAKALHASPRFSLLADWAEFASPTWFAGFINLYSNYNLAESHGPLFNLVVSNVPGPPLPLYCAGKRVTHCYPMGPIFEGAAVNITVMSYVDHVDIGVIACPESAPDIWLITDAFERAVRRLLATTRTRRKTPTTAARQRPTAKKRHR